MKCLFVLSGENIQMAAAEAAAVLGLKKPECDGRLMAANVKSKKELDYAAKRLALTHSILSVLFSFPVSKIAAKISAYDWSRIYRESFSVRIHNYSKRQIMLTEKELAGIIWNKLKMPVVNLENPQTPIHIIISEKTAYCCILISEIKHNFEQRKPEHRPGFSPVSLHPRLARAIVNLTGIKKGILCDPFCGTGGLLIEAGLIGFRAVGYDIDEKMLDKYAANMQSLGIKDFSAVLQDATKIGIKYDYIATDLPYGRNSKITESAGDLYLRFLLQLKKILGRKAVIVFPSNSDYKNIIRRTGLKTAGEYSHYIHKSLTKKIVVIENVPGRR